mmetsp:Transcript_8977/g.20753  ORF Transcript_8977/g.20753 Transcript_8977/m.20753 type:complete len:83 (+) Transcript_8977:730-978(+)
MKSQHPTTEVEFLCCGGAWKSLSASTSKTGACIENVSPQAQEEHQLEIKRYVYTNLTGLLYHPSPYEMRNTTTPKLQKTLVP